jgi:hypothetical protein
MSFVRRFGLLVLLLSTHSWAGPELIRDAPQVWNVKPTEATIAWFTNEDGRKCQLQFGITPEYGTSADPASRAWPLVAEGSRTFQHHVVTLRDLKPDTKYYYRVVAGDVSLTPDAASKKEDYYFLTAKLPTDHSPFTFLVVGGAGEVRLRAAYRGCRV